MKNRKKSPKTQKNQKRLEICRNKQYALWPEASNPSGGVVSTMFCKAKSAKKTIYFCAAILDHFQTKMFQSETTSFHYFSPKDSESLKILDIQLCEVGAKRRSNGTSKVNTQTDGQTDKQKDGHFDFFVEILDLFMTKKFKSETTSFHYFSPRIPNL